MPYYAYKTQEAQGICTTWKECESFVKGKSGASFKKFTAKEDAQSFLDKLNDPEQAIVEKETDRLPEGYAVLYVDGSYNAKTNEYGYGIYCTDCYGYWTAKGKGMCLHEGRNVEGEVAAAQAALQYILKNKLYTSVTVYHDYEGVGKWADHHWKTNKQYTTDYALFIDEARKQINITFVHINGHTGDLGNEFVDKLAKKACNVPFSSKDKTFIGLYNDELFENEIQI